MEAAESFAPPTKEDVILNLVKQKVGADWEIWTKFSVIPPILKSRWGELSLLLNNKVIPTATAWMIAYRAALSDGCPRCIHLVRSRLLDLGVGGETVSDIGKSIKGKTLEFHTKYVLAYAAACAHDPHQITQHNIDSFQSLGVPEQELLHIAVTVDFFRSLFDVQHSLGLHNPDQRQKKPMGFKIKKHHLR